MWLLYWDFWQKEMGKKAFLSSQFCVKFWGKLSILNRVDLKQWEYKKKIMLSIAKVTHYISYCAVGRDTKNWWRVCIWCEARQGSSSEGICSVLTQSGMETGPWKEKQVCSSPNAGKGKHNQHQSWQWTMRLNGICWYSLASSHTTDAF